MSNPGAPYDPRGVANMLLDMLASRERQASHIDLQKLLYFAHGRFLLATGAPLVSGYFEAWQFGPVHPAVYQSFKKAGNRKIDFRAVKTNLITGEERTVDTPDSLLVKRHIDAVVASYGELTTGQLVDLAHAAKGPWDQTVKRVSREITLGTRISNDVIKECGPTYFRGHSTATFPLAAAPPRGGSASDRAAGQSRRQAAQADRGVCGP